jgi:hypothetical protein
MAHGDDDRQHDHVEGAAMKRLALLSIALGACCSAFALGGFVDPRPAPGFIAPRVTHARANPLWRNPHRAHMPRFRNHGRTFIFIGAPVYVAPWLSYPYAADTQWGARYSFPGEQESFLFYCPDTGGFVPEGACPAGWWPVVPDEAPEPQY